MISPKAMALPMSKTAFLLVRTPFSRSDRSSKQFIATGVMLLVQDGRLAVDDRVSKYLEGTPTTWEAITIRHLLTHTSGLVREAPGFDVNKLQTVIVLTNLTNAPYEGLAANIAQVRASTQNRSRAYTVTPEP